MFEYSNAQFFEQYSAIKHWVTKMHSKTVNPTAFILGGQPGAGKTVLQKQIRNNNKINPDLHTVFKILIKTGIFSAYIDDLESSIYQIRAIQQ